MKTFFIEFGLMLSVWGAFAWMALRILGVL